MFNFITFMTNNIIIEFFYWVKTCLFLLFITLIRIRLSRIINNNTVILIKCSVNRSDEWYKKLVMRIFITALRCIIRYCFIKQKIETHFYATKSSKNSRYSFTCIHILLIRGKVKLDVNNPVKCFPEYFFLLSIFQLLCYSLIFLLPTCFRINLSVN